MKTKPQQYVLVIDHVPGQSWEAAFEGDEPTLGTGGFGWEAQSPSALLASVSRALTVSANEYKRRWDDADAPTDHELVTDHSQCQDFWPECKESQRGEG